MKFNRKIEGKTTDLIRGTTPEILKHAQEMRRSMTPSEARLYTALKQAPLRSLRFRSQHHVGVWILDFYCPSIKLVIEVDGESHANKQEYDEIRTSNLEAHGYCILGFKNEDVMDDLPLVISKIQTIAKQLLLEKSLLIMRSMR